MKPGTKIAVTMGGERHNALITDVVKDITKFYVLSTGKVMQAKSVMFKAPAVVPAEFDIPAEVMTDIQEKTGFGRAPLKKGDKVSFKMGDGSIGHGFVESVGKQNVRVVLVGGEKEIKGHPSLFKASDFEVEKDKPSPMDRYTITKAKVYESMSEETTCFEAVICKDGKPVFHARNDGHGGCNSYYSLEPKAVDEFIDAIKGLNADLGANDVFEPEDLWITWKINSEKYGVTYSSYLKKFQEDVQSYGP